MPLIDVHHHFYPPAYMKLWLDYEDQRNIPHFNAQLAWTCNTDVEDMDRNGIETGVLSLASTPGVWFDAGAQKAHELARLSCDFAADMMRDWPGRYALFAPLSMLDSDLTLHEIDTRSIRLRPNGRAQKARGSFANHLWHRLSVFSAQSDQKLT
jgi:6-methylsalicylate decarboxylase